MLSRDNEVREQNDNESNVEDIDSETRKKRGRVQVMFGNTSPPPVNRRSASRTYASISRPDQLRQEERDGQDTPQQLRPFSEDDERHGRRRSHGLVKSEQKSDALGEMPIPIQFHFVPTDFRSSRSHYLRSLRRRRTSFNSRSLSISMRLGLRFSALKMCILNEAIRLLLPDDNILPNRKQLGSILLDSCHAEIL